jgi:hypothetical protein
MCLIIFETVFALEKELLSFGLWFLVFGHKIENCNGGCKWDNNEVVKVNPPLLDLNDLWLTKVREQQKKKTSTF